MKQMIGFNDRYSVNHSHVKMYARALHDETASRDTIGEPFFSASTLYPGKSQDNSGEQVVTRIGRQACLDYNTMNDNKRAGNTRLNTAIMMSAGLHTVSVSWCSCVETLRFPTSFVRFTGT